MQFRGEYDFLSNFYFSRMVHARSGKVVATVEHGFQASKTLDPTEQLVILQADTPASAKRMGRRVTLRKDWEEKKVDIMTAWIRLKFSNPVLAQKLVATGNLYLEEGNTWGDTFWGVCKGKGKNMLGQILMAERARLMK